METSWGKPTSAWKPTEQQVRTKLKRLVLEAKCMPDVANNDILNKFFEIMKRTNYNIQLFKAGEVHLQIMSRVIVRNKREAEAMNRRFDIQNLTFIDMKEGIDYYIARLFFTVMPSHKPVSFSVSIDDKEPDWYIPFQFFLKEDPTDGRLKQEFENKLKKFDVLFVEVIKNESTDSEKLLSLRIISVVNEEFVVHQDFAYYFNFIVYAFRDMEMERLGLDELKSSEVLKVIIFGQKSNRFFVTMNNNRPDVKIKLNLGIVQPEDMPPFLKSFKKSQKYPSYVDYLHSQPEFFNHTNLTEEIRSIGIDPYRFYSFNEALDGMTAPVNSDLPCTSKPTEIRQNCTESQKQESLQHLEEAKKFVKSGEYCNAIEEFEKSEKLYNGNAELYILRGLLYHSKSMVRGHHRSGSFLDKAVVDFETAIKLDPNAITPKLHLSKIYVYLAKRMIKQRKFDKAILCINHALRLCPKNFEAFSLLKQLTIRKSHASDYSDSSSDDSDSSDEEEEDDDKEDGEEEKDDDYYFTECLRLLNLN